MKFLKLYAVIFGALALFNGRLGLKLRKESEKETESLQQTQDTKTTTTTNEVVEPEEPTTTITKAELEDKILQNTISSAVIPAAEKEEGEPISVFGSGYLPPKTKKKLEFFKMDVDPATGKGRICFSDVGVNSVGVIVGVDFHSTIYEYEFVTDNFIKIRADYEVDDIWRLDISYEGFIYVVTRCGSTYYLDCERRWVKLPGCAIDIGAGRGDEIYKIGCNKKTVCYFPQLPGAHKYGKPSSPHVYKLKCRCKCRCCFRRCFFFIKKYGYKTCEPADVRQCHWIRLPNDLVVDYKLVAFTRIDVKITGFPVVTDGAKRVYEFIGGDSNRFKEIHKHTGNSNINDVTSDNHGFTYYSTNNSIFVLLNSGAKLIVDTAGNSTGASDMSAGPYGIFSFIKKKEMYTIAKQSYN